MITLDIDKAVREELAREGVATPSAGHGSVAGAADTHGGTATVAVGLGKGWAVGGYLRRLWTGPTEGAASVKKEW